jgi:hypothetical protein
MCAGSRFWHKNHSELVSVLTKYVLASTYNKLLERNFQEVFSSQFLAKPVVGIDVIGPLQPSIFHSEHCKELILTL